MICIGHGHYMGKTKCYDSTIKVVQRKNYHNTTLGVMISTLKVLIVMLQIVLPKHLLE